MPNRCDIFFFISPGQPTTTLAGFTLSLFADDGSAQHFPGAQVRSKRATGRPEWRHVASVSVPPPLPALVPALPRAVHPVPEQPRDDEGHVDADLGAGRELQSCWQCNSLPPPRRLNAVVNTPAAERRRQLAAAAAEHKLLGCRLARIHDLSLRLDDVQRRHLGRPGHNTRPHPYLHCERHGDGRKHLFGTVAHVSALCG